MAMVFSVVQYLFGRSRKGHFNKRRTSSAHDSNSFDLHDDQPIEQAGSTRGAIENTTEGTPPRRSKENPLSHKFSRGRLMSDNSNARSEHSPSIRDRLGFRKSVASASTTTLTTGNGNAPESTKNIATEIQQAPPNNRRSIHRDELSETESITHVNSEFVVLRVPASPEATISRQNSHRDSGVVIPRPPRLGGMREPNRASSESSQLLRPEPPGQDSDPGLGRASNAALAEQLYSAPSPPRTRKATSTSGDVVSGAKLATRASAIVKSSVAKSSVVVSSVTDKDEGYGSVSLDEEYAEGRKLYDIPDIDRLFTNDPSDLRHMDSVPHSPRSVEPPKELTNSPAMELRRTVAQLKHNVQHRGRKIQNISSLLHAKNTQISVGIEETFWSLRDFTTRRHSRAQVQEFMLNKVSNLHLASLSNRKECGPLIDEISSLMEIQVVEEELLSQAEDRLYEILGVPLIGFEGGPVKVDANTKPNMSGLPPKSKPRHPPRNNAGAYADQDDDSDSDAYSFESAPSITKRYHPFYIDYQEALGTLDNLHERYTQLINEKYSLEEQQESRQKVGLNLQKDDQEFLDNFNITAQELNKEIENASFDIKQWRTKCLEQGLIDEADNYIGGTGDAHDDATSDSGLDLDLDLDDSSHSLQPPQPSGSPPPPYARTMPPDTASSPAHPTSPPLNESYISDNLGIALEERTYQSRINPWLLDKLAASRKELTLLATVVSATGIEPDTNTILDVLTVWDRDGAGFTPPQRLGALDVETINKLRQATREIVGSGFGRELVSQLFGLSLGSGGIYAKSGESEYLNHDE